MLVVFACDENLEDIDIVNLPTDDVNDLAELQGSFFAWMFDKSNEHEYWIIKESSYV